MCVTSGAALYAVQPVMTVYAHRRELDNHTVYSRVYCLGNQVLEIETLDFARDVLSNIGNRPLLLSKYWELD